MTMGFSWQGGRVRAADGTSIAFLCAGDGPLIVIVHGGLGQGADWAPIAQQLTDSYRVVLIDRRNSGNSSWADEIGVDIEARDVLAVLDRVGPADLVVGASYGAAVVLHAALHDTRRISGLVLYEPPLAIGGALIDEQILRRWHDLAEEGDYATVLAEFHLPPISSLGAITLDEISAMQSLPDFDIRWAALVGLAPVVEPSVRSVNQLKDASRYQAIKVPTLLLAGTESAEHPFQDTIRSLVEAMPNASVAMLEGQRHLATIFAPQLVTDSIRSFAAITSESKS